MARSLILDTNVFYNLGSGRLAAGAFMKLGDILYMPLQPDCHSRANGSFGAGGLAPAG